MGPILLTARTIAARTPRRRGAPRWIAAAIACLAMGAAGCPAPEATTQPAQAVERTETAPADKDSIVGVGESPGRTHVVQPNDTLYGLAQRYYGSGQQYRRILIANRKRLKDPNNLPVGMKLIIP